MQVLQNINMNNDISNIRIDYTLILVHAGLPDLTLFAVFLDEAEHCHICDLNFDWTNYVYSKRNCHSIIHYSFYVI